MAWTLERVERCGSTQDVARERAAAGCPDRTAIIAHEMDDGCGTHGRAWHAPPGGLYLSLVLRHPPRPELLTLALGNAVADVLEVAGADARLKWVNDVLVGDRKIAGMLVEAEGAGAVELAVAGIGINVQGSASDWPQPLRDGAVTLEDVLGAEPCMEDLESFLLDSIDGWLDRLAMNRGDDVVAAWRARDALRGRRIGVDPDGDFCSKVVGVAAGITDAGHLRVETDDGEQVFATGSIVLM